MFKDLIYKENKVFSTQLKRSDSIEALLSKIRQKEDLGTAILLLEGKDDTNALFILENKLYALCCVDALHITPLLFSDFFKEPSQDKTQVALYQVSPVLFKCLLILAQYSPSVIGPSAVIDIEGMLGYISKQGQEALLIFKQDAQVQLFYFLDGNVRDMYCGGKGKISIASDLKKQVLDASAKDKTLHIELFDETEISAASDRDLAEQIIDKAQVESTPIQEENGTKKETPLWVKVLGGSRAGFLIRVSSEPVSLGRGKVAVRLNDPQVSRFHAELAWGKDGLFIRDNHSTNGIFVNDEKVSQKNLILNDLIRLGDVRLKVVSGS